MATRLVRKSLLALICLAARGQNESAISFDAAAIKLAPPPEGTGGYRTGCFGGPGSNDPGRYVCDNATVSLMALQAYRPKTWQFAKFEDSPRYNVAAKVPAGATEEQVHRMMQRLLAERFHLAYHFEKRDMKLYELTVDPSGSKLREAPADGSDHPAKPGVDADGFRINPPPRGSISVARNGGRIRLIGNATSLDQLVNSLERLLGRPAINRTGLAGAYSFTLTFADTSAPSADPAAGDDAAPSVFTALRRELGLKLDATTGAVDQFVIDRVEKPEEN